MRCPEPQVLLAILLVGSCGGEKHVEQQTTRPSASASAEVAAQNSPAPELDHEASASPAPPIVNLLKVVPAQVVVSSASSPGMSGPSRMIDGRMDTAWNSRTGDLVGAWVAVLLPESVQITSIAIVPGYVRNYQGQDLFRANHRIKRVRVLRGDTIVGEYNFDIERAELQELPVQGPGGLYRIEILSIEPGSRTTWRETCITELEVRGRPGVPLPAAPVTAEARIGTLRGSGRPELFLEALPEESVRRFQPIDEYAPMDELLADGHPPDAEVDRFLQGNHLSAIRPLQIIERTDDTGGRGWLALYYVSPDEEDATRERMERRRPRARRDDEPCDEGEEKVCPSIYLARVSILDREISVVEGLQLVADDVCSHKLRFATRDLDRDGTDEVYVRLDWRTHPVCPIGGSGQHREFIFDIETLRKAFEIDLGAFSGYDCFTQGEGRRTARDLNADGHPDFIVRRREEDVVAEGGCRADFVREEWLYSASDDAWHRRATPD